jgi:hypothetical protein
MHIRNADAYFWYLAKFEDRRAERGNFGGQYLHAWGSNGRMYG